MKTRLLVGLVAVALGGLTSCSNILEENGVINNVAESGMGELRIDLSTDVSLNVSTKVTEVEIETTITESDFTIYGKLKGKDEVTNLGKYATSIKVQAGEYEYFKATCDKMGNALFAINTPYFEESANNKGNGYTVNTENSEDVTIDAELRNSVVTVDLGNLTEYATINKLELRDDKDTPNENNTLNLLDNDGGLTKQQIFVKAGLNNAYIHIEGLMNDGSNKTFTYTQHIGETEETATASKKKYAVAYSLSTINGLLTLTIHINKKVAIVPINVPAIDPYE